jgi:groucho
MNSGGGAGGGQVSGMGNIMNTLEACERIKEEYQFLTSQNQSLKVQCEKLAQEKNEIQTHYNLIYEMSYGINNEMHKQTEIAKRMRDICSQIIPYLPPEHQVQVTSAIERCKSGLNQDMNSAMMGQPPLPHGQNPFPNAALNQQPQFAQFAASLGMGNLMGMSGLAGLGIPGGPGSQIPPPPGGIGSGLLALGSVAGAIGNNSGNHYGQHYSKDSDKESIDRERTRGSVSPGRAQHHQQQHDRSKSPSDNYNSESNNNNNNHSKKIKREREEDRDTDNDKSDNELVVDDLNDNSNTNGNGNSNNGPLTNNSINSLNINPMRASPHENGSNGSENINKELNNSKISKKEENSRSPHSDHSSRSTPSVKHEKSNTPVAKSITPSNNRPRASPRPNQQGNINQQNAAAAAAALQNYPYNLQSPNNLAAFGSYAEIMAAALSANGPNAAVAALYNNRMPFQGGGPPQQGNFSDPNARISIPGQPAGKP